MVKKTSKKKVSQNLKSLSKKIWSLPLWIKVIAVLLLMVAGITLNNIYQQRQLENRFAKIDKSLDQIMFKINERYPSAAIQKDAYCSHQEVKYGGGKQFCLATIRAGEPFLKEEGLRTVYDALKEQGFNQQAKTNEYIKEGILISSSYRYEKEKIICALNIDRQSISSNLHSFNISCSEKSKRAFYPYRD